MTGRMSGENPEIAVNRAKEQYDQIYEEADDGDHILVVSHGAIFMHMMRLLMGIDLDLIFELLKKRGREDGVVANGYAADILIEDGQYKLMDLKGLDGLYDEYRKICK